MSARAWRALMGPVSAPQAAAALAGAGTAAVTIGRRTAHRRGAARGLALGAVAFDLVGGLISFQLPPTRAAYARHGMRERLGFVAVHVQPFVLPLCGDGSWARASARYLAALAATVALEAGPERGSRRLAANALAVALAALDAATDRSPQRWLGPVYLLKVVGGHAGVPRGNFDPG